MPKLSQTLECAFDKQNLSFKILKLPSGWRNRGNNPVLVKVRESTPLTTVEFDSTVSKSKILNAKVTRQLNVRK